MKIEDGGIGHLSPEVIQEEVAYEINLRPRNLDDFIGQAKIKENLTQVYEQLPRVKLFGVDVNAKLKDGFRGFSNGYNTAVDVYFHFYSGTKKHVEVSKDPAP